jgi:L-alanine-DL-glutamate epimerase-like enolase superfamily enzyme
VIGRRDAADEDQEPRLAGTRSDGGAATKDPDRPTVTGVRASAYTVPTDAPEADGTLAWDSTTLVLVEAHAGDKTGIGYTYAPRAAAAVVAELLDPAVTGRDALDVEGSWTAMVRAVRNAGRPGLVGMAISAVDIALWDLAARLHELPLTTLWADHDNTLPDPGTTGETTTSRVKVYGSGGFTTYDGDRLRRQLHGWLELGCRQVKIKIAESWGTRRERDLARIRVAQQAIGDDATLFVDANGGYTLKEACVVGCFLDMLGVTWFEEPVSSEDHSGLATVRDHVRADVAAGEYGYDLAYCTRLAPYVDCLQVDVTRCGGYTEWRRIAADPDLARRDLSGHCAPYITLPVAALTPRLRHLEYFHDHVRIERLLFDGCPEPVNGGLEPPQGPGHGLTFRTHDAEEYRIA